MKASCVAADLPTALARVSGAWLIAMPVAACNLILVTAAEGEALVGDSLFGHVLPLAARGASLDDVYYRASSCQCPIPYHMCSRYMFLF